jgi:hypothetical protein
LSSQGGIRKSIASEIVENGTRKHYIANNPLLLSRNSSPISQKKKKKKKPTAQLQRNPNLVACRAVA